MHLELPHLIYSGPTIDDPEILERCPRSLAAALRTRNGCIAYQGGLHIRGAVEAPLWHSLRAAWDGPDALHELYPELTPDDVPFGEDAVGDQFIVRGELVFRLRAETGELEEAAVTLEAFVAKALADAEPTLELAPLLAFRADGRELEPGQLLSAYPPFCVEESRTGVTLRAIPAIERRHALAALAGQIRDLPDGATIALKLVD
jgi:hypothetical protein